MKALKDIQLGIRLFQGHKLRNNLIVLTIAIAFLLYGVLGSLRYSMSGGDDTNADNRLIVTHEAGIIRPLPINYKDRILTIPGVEQVCNVVWMGAYYQNPKDMLMAFAVDPLTWLQQHPDMQITQQQTEHFLKDRQSILVSADLANQYQWEIGDRVPFGNIMFSQSNGQRFWTYTIAGTFTSDESSGGRNYIISHYDYLNDGRNYLKDTVGTFVVSGSMTSDMTIVASDIDTLFSTADNRTSTASDKAFHAAFYEQLGDLFFIIKAIIIVAFVSIILIVSSAMILSIRQRTAEIGLLKVVGFKPNRVLRVIYTETMLLTIIGGLMGLFFAVIVNRLIGIYLPSLLPSLTLPSRVFFEALMLMTVSAIITGLVPAVIALKMKPIEAFTSEQ